MFSFTTIATVALSAISAVNGLAIPRASVPSTYNEGYLEKYATYHARYLALGCENKHNTAFFDQCCHPLLATETLAANRPAQCNPNAPSSLKATASPTPSADPDGDDDCEDGDDEDSSSAPVSTPSPTPSPTPTQAPNNVAPSPSITPSSSSKASSSKVSSSKVSSSKASSSSKAPTPSKAAPAASPSPSKSSSSGSGDLVDGGFATFFFQGGVAGACGTVHSDNDFVAAMDERRYGDSSKKSALCGRQVHITNKNNGKSVTVTVADDCPTCENANSIDLSVAAFKAIATEEEGMVPIEWSFSS